MIKIVLPVFLLALIFFLARFMTLGIRSKHGRIENLTDTKLKDFYWEVDYSCGGRNWSTVGHYSTGDCGERHHKIPIRSNGRFKFPSAVFFTRLLMKPYVDSDFYLKHK